MKRVMVPLAVLGILGIAGFSIAAEPPPRHAASDARLASSPVLPETVVAPNATLVGPVLTPGLAAATHRVPGPVVGTPAPSKGDRRVLLVEARILEKYLPFLESLTSP